MPLNSTNVLRGDVARLVVVEPWKHVEALLCGFCAALLLLWVQARYALVWVVGESMEPTLRSGSLVVVNKTAYREASPCRDDLVVALYRDELIAKRVVGLPGETVEVKQGVVLVDGVARSEEHPILAGTMTISPGTLFPDRYALLGDNRSLPAGVLVHAVVSKHALMGKVVAQWPGRA